MKEAFIDWKPTSKGNKVTLQRSIEVIDDYRNQGYRLTLRQLYYQLVARDFIPNNLKSYKSLGELISKARLGGHIDWDDIVDRGRVPTQPPEWEGPGHIIRSAARQYRLDRWANQDYYVEVWCEKEALASVLEPPSLDGHIRYLSNKGYSSSTAMYDGAQRLFQAIQQGKTPVVLYFGDHDPSGIDMSRDIRERLQLMTYGAEIEVRRLALNFPQVVQYNPPPNYAKTTDSRYQEYIDLFGVESWELDALEPQVLNALVESAIREYLDQDKYDERIEQENRDKEALMDAAEDLEEQEEDEETE